MKRISIISILSLFSVVTQAQTLNCNSFCVTDISIDSITGEMLVAIYNGDTSHVNYPIVQVIDANGDTIGNPDGLYFFFAHMPGTLVTHSIPTTITSLPGNFSGIVLLTDPLWNNTCIFSIPMNCFLGQPWPDCNNLTVENISIDSVAGLMDITIFNNCNICASGINGPVYCEMKVIRNIAPFDTLAEANCFCFLTPDNNSFQTYTLSAYVNSLPPLSDISVIFHCGSSTCDTLQINPILNINELNNDDKIYIFPNPSRDIITVMSDKLMEEINIFNLNGELVLRKSLRSRKAVINLDMLSKGFYILKTGNNYHLIIKQ